MNTDKIIAESIAKEYAPDNTSRLVALRKLDVKAKLPANIFAYGCGIVSTLVFGGGMTMAMGNNFFIQMVGILVGVIGLIGCGVNYPIYKRLLKKGKEKYAYEIIELARQIAEE